MAKKKQQTNAEQIAEEEKQPVAATDNVAESVADDIPNSEGLSVESTGVVSDAEINAEHQSDELAKALTEEQTTSAAATVALDADPVATPADAVEKKPEEGLADRVRIVSPMKLVFKRFFRSRLSVIGLMVFLALFVFSFLGPVFVGWESDEVDDSPSQQIYYNNEYNDAFDDEGNPLSYYVIESTRPDNLNAHADVWTYSTNKKGERALHVLGTDKTGYDIFVRLMYGGRMSLLLSFIVVLVYTFLGIVLGGLAGYFGGWVDMVIMRIVDVLNCIPSLPILIIIGAIYNGLDLPPELRVYFMMGVLTLLSWPGTARLVRGQILFLREQEYMVAADALGFSASRKIFKHLVPNVMPQLIVSMTLGLGGTILTEASLSYLSLGAPPEVASLGQMVSLATKGDLSVLTYYMLDWMPAGIVIVLAVVAFNFIGDGLRDALDPKMKR
ncbi:MAG: ABC transporter permease [Clostridiales bacterium]|nr:ABC transporter permease [Clostridiales bacterium]